MLALVAAVIAWRHYRKSDPLAGLNLALSVTRTSLAKHFLCHPLLKNRSCIDEIQNSGPGAKDPA